MRGIQRQETEIGKCVREREEETEGFRDSEKD